MTYVSLRQRLFDFAAALSLLLCLVCGALWARSLGHFERVDLRYARWRQADDVQSYFAALSWYSNTLRVEVISLPFGPAFFQGQPAANVQHFRDQHPRGARWEFNGENITAVMNGYPPGYSAQHTPYSTAGVTGDRYVLAVRPWLPTLLAAVLPFAWLVFYCRRTRTGWQFGLRDLFIALTLLSVLLAGGLWLMH